MEGRPVYPGYANVVPVARCHRSAPLALQADEALKSPIRFHHARVPVGWYGWQSSGEPAVCRAIAPVEGTSSLLPPSATRSRSARQRE
jgi:hypothetical protein